MATPDNAPAGPQPGPAPAPGANPASRGPAPVPVPDVDASVAGEEDPGAALDLHADRAATPAAAAAHGTG